MEFEDSVIAHYEKETERQYIHLWNPNHMHFGLFEPGECPPLTLSMEQRYSSFSGVDRAVQRMIDVVVAPAGIDCDSYVVDTGCGIGGTAIRLANIWSCKVVGINISETQLKIANRKAEEAGLEDRVTFKHGNCSKSLPFANNSVDVVVNLESACHYADRAKFLQEAYRILKLGGKIVAEDWLAVDGLSHEQYEQFIQPVCDSWSMHSLESESGYTRKLQQAGFNLLEFEGFDGRDLDNLKILENCYTNFFSRYLAGYTDPDFLAWLERFGTLSTAWKKGYFELGRYCARK